MPMSDALAFRMGRADLMPYYGAPTNGAIAMDDTAMGAGVESESLSAGRIGLALIVIYIGAIATGYLATRARQF